MEAHKYPNLQVSKKGGDPRLVFLSGSGRISGILNLHGMSIEAIRGLLHDHGLFPNTQAHAGADTLGVYVAAGHLQEL